MATYNGSRFIGEQLASLSCQTVLPAELIVTDDGSTDDTINIVEAFARNAPFKVHIERNAERLGYQANFMRAASLCSSELVSFCDQDDVWHEQKLAACLRRFSDSAVLLVYHNAQVVSENMVPLGDLSYLGRSISNIPQFGLGPLLFPLGFTMTFRRDLLKFEDHWKKSVNYDFEGKPESHDQWIPFLANTFGPTVYLEEHLAKYRRHDHNAGPGTRWRLGRGARLKRLAQPALEGWSNFAATFGRRAEILEDIMNAPPAGFSAESASEGATRYRAYEHLYRRRIALHQNNFLIDRISLFLEIAGNGGYRLSDPWSKGLKSAGKDLIRGVLRI
jgi:glycosyltransferase involved in cell wall biosynthesis